MPKFPVHIAILCSEAVDRSLDCMIGQEYELAVAGHVKIPAPKALEDPGMDTKGMTRFG